MKAPLLICSVLFILTCKHVAAQAPHISYTPSTNVYTLGTAIPTLSPANSGGAVAAVGYGAGTPLTGAALSNPYGMGIDPSGNIYVITNAAVPAYYVTFGANAGTLTVQTWAVFTINNVNGWFTPTAGLVSPIYPYPATEPVSLTINKSGSTSSFNIRIVNNIGALIKESNSMQPSWQTDTSQLLPGAYFTQVTNKNDNSLVGKTTNVKL